MKPLILLLLFLSLSYARTTLGDVSSHVIQRRNPPGTGGRARPQDRGEPMYRSKSGLPIGKFTQEDKEKAQTVRKRAEREKPNVPKVVRKTDDPQQADRLKGQGKTHVFTDRQNPKPQVRIRLSDDMADTAGTQRYREEAYGETSARQPYHPVQKGDPNPNRGQAMRHVPEVEELRRDEKYYNKDKVPKGTKPAVVTATSKYESAMEGHIRRGAETEAKRNNLPISVEDAANDKSRELYRLKGPVTRSMTKDSDKPRMIDVTNSQKPVPVYVGKRGGDRSDPRNWQMIDPKNLRRSDRKRSGSGKKAKRQTEIISDGQNNRTSSNDTTDQVLLDLAWAFTYWQYQGAEIIYPILDEMLNYTNDEYMYDAAWSIMSLIYAPVYVCGALLGEFSSYDSIEEDYTSPPDNETTLALASDWVVYNTYQYYYDMAEEKLNSSGIAEELDLVTGAILVIADNYTGKLPEILTTVDADMDWDYFLQTNWTYPDLWDPDLTQWVEEANGTSEFLGLDNGTDSSTAKAKRDLPVTLFG